MIEQKLGKKWRYTKIFASRGVKSVNRPPHFPRQNYAHESNKSVNFNDWQISWLAVFDILGRAGHVGRLGMWDAFNNIFVKPRAILPWLRLKILYWISIYPKKFWDDWMKYAGFVMNFHFLAKKVTFWNWSGNLIYHWVLEIETYWVMSNQLWQLGYSSI